MAAPSELERDLQLLATELRRLEAEYNMFFGGRTPRPPQETRGRVEALLKRLDRAPFEQLAQRFRLQTLQSRFATFAELWDRSMRAREGGRAAPRAASPPHVDAHAAASAGQSPHLPPSTADDPPPSTNHAHGDRLVREAVFDDRCDEPGRLEELYASLMDARRESGERVVPFDRFAELVKGQLRQMRADGAGEVAFRVAIRDGKVRVTARAERDAEG